MPELTHVSPRSRNLICLVLALLFSGFLAYSLVMTSHLVNRPFAGFLLLRNNFIPVMYLPGWEGFQQGVALGDIVTEVNGRPVDKAFETRLIVDHAPPGSSLTYTVLRGSERLEFTVPARLFSWQDLLVPTLIWTLTGASFYFLGLTVFYLRPNFKVARAFLVFGVIAGASMVSAPGFCLDNSNFLPLIFLTLLGPGVLNLALYFPVEVPRRNLVQVPLVLVSVPLVGFYIYYYHTGLAGYLVVDKLFLALLALTFGGGVLIMIRSFFSSTDAAVRQKGKVVVFGFALGAMAAGFGLILSLFLKVLNFFWLFPAFAAVPATMAYAILKQNIFDADAFIRRSAGYLLVSAFVAAVSVMIISVLSFLLSRVTGEPAEVAAVLTIMIMVLVFRPLKDAVDREIERRFYGERRGHEQTLAKAARILTSIIELDELVNQIVDTLADALKISRGVLLLKAEQETRFELMVERDFSDDFQAESLGEAEAAALGSIAGDEDLASRLEQTRHGLHRSDLEREEEKGREGDSILEFMRRARIVLATPVIYEHRLIGVLGLGHKITGEGYNTREAELIRTLMDQTALSIANARKVEKIKSMVEFETRYNDLKRLDEMKDNFLSMVSHDLRTPMTGIKAYASLILERLDKIDRPSQKKYLEIIIAETDRLTRLITDLLDVQRFEAGRMELEFDRIEMTALIVESLDAFYGAAGAKKIALDRSLPKEKIFVRGHRDRLHQVMANLVSNAVKFTPEGGRIKVRAEGRSREGNRAIKVTVEDDGPGIAPEQQERLFDKFHQVHRLVRDKEQGSGLGLALVRQIVEYHDGRVGVESEPGKGSRFYFLLPVCDDGS